LNKIKTRIKPIAITLAAVATTLLCAALLGGCFGRSHVGIYDMRV